MNAIAKIAVGAAVAGGLGYLGYRIVKTHKENKEASKKEADVLASFNVRSASLDKVIELLNEQSSSMDKFVSSAQEFVAVVKTQEFMADLRKGIPADLTNNDDHQQPTTQLSGDILSQEQWDKSMSALSESMNSLDQAFGTTPTPTPIGANIVEDKFPQSNT